MASRGRLGTVTWFDNMRCFGFIMPEYGGEDLFFQQPSIEPEGFRPLQAGEPVVFFISEGDRGRARDVSINDFRKARRWINFVKRRDRCDRCHRWDEQIHGEKLYRDREIWLCFSCREEEYFARLCSVMRFKNSSPKADLIKLGLFSPFSPLAIALDLAKHDEEDFTRGVDERNWAEIPSDILLSIFKKIGAVGVITSAQFVCKAWKQLSFDPELWRFIDIMLEDGHFDEDDLETIATVAVDRSAGCLEGFYADCFGTDRLMGYIAERATQLRCLHLVSVYYISDQALVEAVRRFPLLEDFWISPGSFSEIAIALVGQACSQLKTFRVIVGPSFRRIDVKLFYRENVDSKALSIAENMHQLRHLKLFGPCLTNTGLSAILDNCPYLEYLDISGCRNFVLDENLKRECAKMKDFRPPIAAISWFGDFAYM